MKTDLKSKLQFMKQEAEKEVFYYRERIIEYTEADFLNLLAYYEGKYSYSKAYLAGIMDTLNLISRHE